MGKSRTFYSIKNTYIGLIAQLITYVLTFVNRTIFIRYLDVVYLGCNGLFSNILSMLSLAELGIGTAIVFCLYKPLAEENIQKVCAYMNSYRQAYRIIAFVVAIAGFSLLPFLDEIVAGNPGLSSDEIRAIYILFLSNSILSYFFTYKRSLFSAAQMEYKNTINNTLFAFIRNILQLIVLVITHSYYAYLIVMIICTVLSNIMISCECDKYFPYLKKNTEKLEKNEKKQLYKYVLAQSSHKVGGIVVSGTDNLLITMLVPNGLNLVGLYSNYLIVTSTINSLMSIITRSLTGSIGNLNTASTLEKRKKVFDELMFIVAFFYIVVSVCIACLIQDFISLWLGEKYLLGFGTIIVVIINFYIAGMRTPCQLFNTTLGLFWNDRYKPWVEAIINLIASILLIKYYGLTGVFLGTLISTVCTSIWVEPYILYKHGFRMPLVDYIKMYLTYFAEMIISFAICLVIGKMIPATNWILWIVKGSAIFAVVVSLVLLMSCKQKTFHGVWARMKGLIKNAKKK